MLMIFERSSWMNSKNRYGLFNPYLVASKVRDFRVVHDPERRVEIVSYTEPYGFRWNKETNEIEKAGSSAPIRIEVRY